MSDEFGSLTEFERTKLLSANKALRLENTALSHRIQVLEKFDGISAEPCRWLHKPKGKGLSHKAMPVLLLSDLHLDEVVEPEQVEGTNAYNRQIALRRLQRIVHGAIALPKNHITGLEYDGLTLLLGGDIFSGDIHDELRRTNEDTLFGGFDYWIDHLQTVVLTLLEKYKSLHIAAWTGNHGRNSDKPIFKDRARDNIEWLLYRQLARGLAHETRITWQIPQSADCDVAIYDTVLRCTHGDQFKGGSGISGIMSPLMLGYHRKSQRQASLDKAFDWLVMGHFHQLIYGQGIIVNGSMKGYDEYAYGHNFRFERPQQALFLITPEQGLTFPLSIFAED